jgi:hypothetical protein
MLNFRKIAAASKGRQLLRYFTDNTPEPRQNSPVDEAGRTLEEGGRLTTYYTGRDSRASWRPDMPAILAQAIGIDPRQTPKDAELTALFEARRADTCSGSQSSAAGIAIDGGACPRSLQRL